MIEDHQGEGAWSFRENQGHVHGNRPLRVAAIRETQPLNGRVRTEVSRSCRLAGGLMERSENEQRAEESSERHDTGDPDAYASQARGQARASPYRKPVARMTSVKECKEPKVLAASFTLSDILQISWIDAKLTSSSGRHTAE